MEHSWDSVCLEAHGLVFGDRGATYDHPHDDYSRTCKIFEAKTGIALTPAQGIQFMMSMKESRINNGIEKNLPLNKIRDSVVDLAGYADCLFAELAYPTEEEEWKQRNALPKL